MKGTEHEVRKRTWKRTQQLFRIAIWESLYLHAGIPEETVKLRETCCISRYNILIWSYSPVTRSLSPAQSAPWAITSKRIFGGQTLSCFQTHCGKPVEHVIFLPEFIDEQKSQEEEYCSSQTPSDKNGFLLHQVTHVLHLYTHNVLEHPPVRYGYITSTPLITLVTLIIAPSCSIPILTSKHLLFAKSWRGRVVSFCSYQIHITINTFIPYIKIFSRSV